MILLLVLTTMPLGGFSTHGFSSKPRIPCQSLTATHPSDGIRPWLVLRASRFGAAPAVCNATLSWSAIVTFCDGATRSRVAVRPSSTVWARISAIAAPTERSCGVSAVQASAATWPGGVTSAAPNSLPGITGPCRVQRSSKCTGSAPFTSITASRVSKRAKPSGVRYSSASSGLSFSI